MNTVGWVLIFIAALLVRGMTKGRSVTQLPDDLGDALTALIRNDQAALKGVLARTGDSLTPAVTAPLPPMAGGTLVDPAAGRPGVADPGGEARLTQWTVTARRAIKAQFPGHVIGGYRAGAGAQDHAAGKALDIMASGAKGKEIRDWIFAAGNQSNMGTWGQQINYIIYQQQIWSSARGGEGWRSMATRGSDTADHRDHVHLSMK